MNLKTILAGQLPRLLQKSEGKFLKLQFEFSSKKIVENSKELYFKYQKEFEGCLYILTEEYLFRDHESILDVNRAIAVNYYLKIKSD